MEMLRAPGLLVIPAQGEEISVPGRGPEETVLALSLAKAREVASARPAEDVVVAADTVVCIDGAILGKPADAEDARRMLGALSGKTHEVWTGVTVIRADHTVTGAELTRVTFRELGESEIAAYVASGEPMDKAGAYAAQGLAALFVERLDGDFFNVMGLPLCRLGRLLEEVGVKLL